jgi:hypothetical protein
MASKLRSPIFCRGSNFAPVSRIELGHRPGIFLGDRIANASEGRNFIETVWGRGYVLRAARVEERIPASSDVHQPGKQTPPRGGVLPVSFVPIAGIRETVHQPRYA